MFIGAKSLLEIPFRFIAECQQVGVGGAENGEMLQLSETRWLGHVVFDLAHHVLRRFRARRTRKNTNETGTEQFLVKRKKRGGTATSHATRIFGYISIIRWFPREVECQSGID